MPAEKRMRKHSLQVQSPQESADGSHAKKRKKEKSGKEKRKRKPVDGLREGDDARVKNDNEDIRSEVNKKKHSKTEVGDDADILSQSPHKTSELDQEKKRVEGEAGSDLKQDMKEKRKSKKKKNQQRESHLREEGAGMVKEKSSSKPSQPAQGQGAEKGKECGQRDIPDENGVKEGSSNDNGTPAANLKQPASVPKIPLEDPTDATAKPSDKPVDENLTAVSKKQERGEKRKDKNKSKRRKSQLSDDQSGIELTQSPAPPRDPMRKASGEDNKNEQLDKPNTKGLSPKAPSKGPTNRITMPSDRDIHGRISTSSKEEDLREKKDRKKRRRKSQPGGEDGESDVERAKSPVHTYKPTQKKAIEQRNEIKQSDKPGTIGMKQKSAPDNGAPSVESRQPASTSESPANERSKKPSEQTEDDDDPLDDKRLPRTLFVGNVPQTTTRKELRKIFSEYSPIETIRIRNVIPVNPKIPKKAALLAGRLARFSNSFSAYIVFKETENMEQVLERAVKGSNMTIFQDHHLRVTKALQTKGKKRLSVFVGNLPFDCTDEELITAFMPVAKECGVRLTNVRVNRDSDTGVGRGCGFATFDDMMGIQACLNKAGEIKIRGRPLRIERAFKTKNMKSKSYKRKWKSAFGQEQS